MAELQRELTKPIINIAGSDDESDAAEQSVAGVSVWQTLLTEKPASKFDGVMNQARKRQSDVERRLEKAFQLDHRVNEALRARKTFSDVRRIVAQSAVVTTVPRDGDTDLKVSYRDQGNLDMYTASNLKKRDANRHHPEVIGALDTFWNVLPKLRSGKINKSIYVWMCRKMYTKLVRNSTDEEFDAVVDEDWRTDSVYGNFMNIRMFRTALFNMADVWCETTDPREYRDFIDRLRKCVEAGVPYTGGLEDDDDDAAMPVPARASRRPSRVGSELPNLSAAPVQAVRVSETDTPVSGEPADRELLALLADEEDLLEETHDAENEATIEMLRALFDLAQAVDGIKEEALLLRAGLCREKQLKMYGEIEPDRATLEEAVIAEIEARRQDSEQRRSKVLEFADIAHLSQEVRGGDHITRVAARIRAHEDTVDQYRRLFTILREALYKNGAQYAERAQQLNKFEVQRLDFKKSAHVDPYDTEHVLYIDHRIDWTQIDFAHQRTVESYLLAESIKLCHNLEEARTLLRSLARQSLHAAIEDQEFDEALSHFERQREDEVEFGTRRWAAICDCLENAHWRRKEWCAGVVESVRDVVSSIQAFELKCLQVLLERERKLDKAVIVAIESDKTLSGNYRELAVQDAVKAAKERQQQRDARVIALKADHAQMTEDLEMLSSAETSRLDLEKQMIESWRKATTLEQIVEPTVAYVETLDSSKRGTTLAATVLSRPTTNLNVSMGGSAYLPASIRTPLDVAIFVDQEETSWFGFHIENLISERLRFVMGCAAKQQRRHIEGLSFMAQHKVAFRLRRVSDIDFYGRISKNDLGFLEREIVRKRVERTAEAKDELKKTLAWRDQTLQEAEEIANIESRALHETRVVMSRIFEVDRTFRDRHIAVQSKWTKLARFKRKQDRIKLRRAERFVTDLGDNELAQRRTEAQKLRDSDKEIARQRRSSDENRRRQDVKYRLAELEGRKKEAAHHERNLKAQEHRKRLFEEQERRQKERLQKEREEREKWHKQFVEEEKRRKKEVEEKKAWQEYVRTTRLEPGGPRSRRASNAEARAPADEALAAPKPTVVRRKSVSDPVPSPAPSVTRRKAPAPAQPKRPIAKPAPKPSRTQRTTMQKYTPIEVVESAPSPTSEPSPHHSVQQRLLATYSGDLATSQAVRGQKAFADRRAQYLAEQMSNREIYVSRCKSLSVTPDTELLQALSTEPLLFDLTTLTMANRAVNVASILDVVLFNPVQRLYLRKADLDDNSVKQLCEGLTNCSFLNHLDIRNNPRITDVGGNFVLSLVKINTHVIRVDSDGTSMGSGLRAEILRNIEANKDGRDLGRAEFQYIQSVFNDMDEDGSGVVTLEELRKFALREARQLSESASPNKLLRHASTMDRMTAELTKRVDSVRAHLCKMADKEGTGEFNLADLICFIFPHWHISDAEAVVKKHSSNDAGPSLEEMREFVETYGTNDALTLNQLATGLGESPESLRTVFGEYDVDNDGRLSLEEFMRFMSA